MKKEIDPRLEDYFFREVAPKVLNSIKTTNEKRPDAIGNFLPFHGFRLHRGYLLPLMMNAHLAGYNVYACDFPNHGLSVLDESQRGIIDNFHDHVNTVRAMAYRTLWSRSRRHLPTILVGHSLGALAVLRCVQTKRWIREHISGVVCISTPLVVDHNISDAAKRFRPVILRLHPYLKNYERWRRFVVDRSAFSEDPSSFPYRLHRFMEYFGDFFHRRHPAPPESAGMKDSEIAFNECVNADPLAYKGPLYLGTGLEIQNAAQATRSNMHKVTVPTLFIHGDEDVTAPLDAVREAQNRLLPETSELVVYEGISHCNLLSVTDRLMDDIIEWSNRRIHTN